MRRRIQMLHVVRALCALSLSASAVVAQNDDLVLRRMVVEGQAELPSHTPSGPLWLVISGMDGTPYGWGMSAVDGSFAIAARVPSGTPLVFVHALDPANPEAMTVSRLLLEAAVPPAAQAHETVATREGPTGEERLIGVAVHAQSTAEVAVLRAAGKANTPLGTLSTPQELDAAARMAQIQMSEFVPQCSVDASAAISDVLQSVIPPDATSVQARFDRFVAGDEPLLERVRNAQEEVTHTVSSANQFTGLVSGLGVGAAVGIRQTRNAIASATPLQGDGFSIAVLPLQDLEKAVQITMDNQWGNCREKGLAGAYIASRFEAFKQIIVVGIEAGGFLASHALAIACTEDASVYNLAFFGDPLNDNPMAPTEMLAAGCMVIDPWLGETVPFTRNYVEAQQWQSVAAPPTVIQLSEATPNELVRNWHTRREEAACAGVDPAVGACSICSGPGTISLQEQCQPFEIAEPPSAWVRMSAIANPHGGPLRSEFPIAGADEVGFRACTLGQNRLDVHLFIPGTDFRPEPMDVEFAFRFETPPQVVAPGETVELGIRGQWHGHPGPCEIRRLEYGTFWKTIYDVTSGAGGIEVDACDGQPGGEQEGRFPLYFFGFNDRGVTLEDGLAFKVGARSGLSRGPELDGCLIEWTYQFVSGR